MPRRSLLSALRYRESMHHAKRSERPQRAVRDAPSATLATRTRLIAMREAAQVQCEAQPEP
jgi:hypothetical protein